MRHKFREHIKRAAALALGALVVFNTAMSPIGMKAGTADVQAAGKKTIKEFFIKLCTVIFSANKSKENQKAKHHKIINGTLLFI